MAAYAKIKASTQDHLDIEDITEDLIILKTGWVALVLTTTAINFDILSEAEQDATIYAYAALLNSLSFPMEILVRSKKADITSYFQSLSEAERNQVNPDLKRQIQKYQDFIQSTVQQKTVLDKKFYLIITFSPLELGLKAVGTRRPTKAKSKAALIADANIALTPKRDHLIKQLARLGLSARQLTTQELIELFYDIYNPAPLGTQRVILDSQSYTVPLVEPALETPAPAPTQPTVYSSGSTETNQATSQSLPEQQLQQSTVNPQPLTNLRPVPPAQSASTQTVADQVSSLQGEISSVPMPSSIPTGAGNVGQAAQQPNIPPSQSEALKNLQEATKRASQFVSQPTKQQPTAATPTDKGGIL